MLLSFHLFVITLRSGRRSGLGGGPFGEDREGLLVDPGEEEDGVAFAGKAEAAEDVVGMGGEPSGLDLDASDVVSGEPGAETLDGEVGHVEDAEGG